MFVVISVSEVEGTESEATGAAAAEITEPQESAEPEAVQPSAATSEENPSVSQTQQEQLVY